MAEVFLARQVGMGCLEKLVSLKRIYPHLTRDQDFVEMFLSEARIAASLEHPKIVQIFDVERHDEGLFIAMEYRPASRSVKYSRCSSSEESTCHRAWSAALHMMSQPGCTLPTPPRIRMA
ncbi:MAG: hypothetical protein GY811_00360 [Myxococcales bacterium]|nr:hypothetical protein [Myxococcales bacterium]